VEEQRRDGPDLGHPGQISEEKEEVGAGFSAAKEEEEVGTGLCRRRGGRCQSGVAEKMRMHMRRERSGLQGEDAAHQLGPWVFIFIFMWTPPYGLDIVEDEIAKDY